MAAASGYPGCPIGTPMLLAFLALSSADARPPCGTLELLPAAGPRRLLPAPPPAPGPKQERDSYGDFPNELVSANFALKWGTRGGVSQDDAEALLDAFEFAWAEQIGARGFPAPEGTDSYLFNVYIGDTGSGAPDGYGTSGYYYRDDDGYPMIVVSAATLEDREWSEGTAAHEFFHAVQDVTGRYSYEGESAWYWEATAVWIEGEVHPDSDSYIAFLFGYALLPHLPVYFFDYPDSGALQEYHQYGAFIFPRYVSEIAADADVIRDSWVEDLDADTPQDAIAQLLEERGVAFADAFGDFAARNVTWDYADGEAYAEWVEAYAGYYRSDDHRVVAEVSRSGTDGLVAAPEDTLPGRYGYNVVELVRPSDGAYRFAFQGDAEGSRGTDAAWRVTLVQDLAGGPRYTPVPITDGAGEVLLEGVDGETVSLVVAAVPDDAREDEVFPWSYAVTFEEAGEDTDPSDDTAGDTDTPDDTGPTDKPGDPLADDDTVELDGGCACTSAPDAGGGWALGALVGAALLVRRRR